MQGLGGFPNPDLDLEFMETSALQNSHYLWKGARSQPQLEPVQAREGPNLILGFFSPQHEEPIHANALILFIPFFEESDHLAVENVSFFSYTDTVPKAKFLLLLLLF